MTKKTLRQRKGEPLDPEFDALLAAMRALSPSDPDYQNFVAGLTSPDPAQRARFEAVFAKLKDETFAEVRPILPALEKAKKAPQKRGPKVRDDAAALTEMRDLVEKRGFSIAKAARDIVERPHHAHYASKVAEQKRLERKFRNKFSK